MSRIKRRRRNKDIVINDQTRLFIKPTVNCCGSEYNYHSCISVGDLSQTRSESQKVYCPSPTEYNTFEEITYIDGQLNDGSGSFATNYKLGHSLLERYYKDGCRFDAQIHIGKCSDPSDFSQYEQIILLRDIEVTGYTVSNLFAKQASERGVVTESADFKFREMITISTPNPFEDIDQLIQEGPIIDSYVFCDSSCCLCGANNGTYLVQLVECDDDCAMVRILYTTDNVNWQKYSSPVCTDIDPSTWVDKNVVIDNDGNFNFFYLNGLGQTIRSSLANGNIQIPTSAILDGSKLIAADGYGCSVVMVGGTYIFVYNTSTQTYYQFTHQRIPINNINYCSVSMLDETTFIVGADNGRVFEINLEEDTVNVNYFNNAVGAIHQLEYVTECEYIVSTDDDFHYYNLDGTQNKVANLYGTVTAIESVSEDIVYLATFDGTYASLWMSANGGKSFRIIKEIDVMGQVITNISVCEEDPSEVRFGGFISGTPIYDTCGLSWNLDKLGVLYWDGFNQTSEGIC